MWLQRFSVSQEIFLQLLRFFTNVEFSASRETFLEAKVNPSPSKNFESTHYLKSLEATVLLFQFLLAMKSQSRLVQWMNDFQFFYFYLLIYFWSREMLDAKHYNCSKSVTRNQLQKFKSKSAAGQLKSLKSFL